jgi:hypothetical protein
MLRNHIYNFTFEDRNRLDPVYESVFKVDGKKYLSPFHYVIEKKPINDIEIVKFYANAYSNRFLQDKVFRNMLMSITEKYIVYNIENQFLGGIFRPDYLLGAVISPDGLIYGNNIIGKILTCLKCIVRGEKCDINLHIDISEQLIELPEFDLGEITMSYIDTNTVFNLSSLLYFLTNYSDLSTIISESGIYGLIWKCIGTRRTLILPNNFENEFKKFIQNDSKRFLILPIMLEDIQNCRIPQPHPQPTHSNILLYDKETNVVERFEPFGYSSMNTMYYTGFYDTNELDYELRRVFKTSTYLSPLNICPEFGPQVLEISEKILPNMNFCTLWIYWYINLRLANPAISDRLRLQSLALEKIKKNAQFFTKYIYNFGIFLKKIEYHLLQTLSKDEPKDQGIIKLIKKLI